MAKLEFCNLSGGLAGAEDDQQSELRGIEDGVEDVMEELLETATDEELAARGCVFSTDLSKIFEKPSAIAPLAQHCSATREVLPGMEVVTGCRIRSCVVPRCR